MFWKFLTMFVLFHTNNHGSYREGTVCLEFQQGDIMQSPMTKWACKCSQRGLGAGCHLPCPFGDWGWSIQHLELVAAVGFLLSWFHRALCGLLSSSAPESFSLSDISAHVRFTYSHYAGPAPVHLAAFYSASLSTQTTQSRLHFPSGSADIWAYFILMWMCKGLPSEVFRSGIIMQCKLFFRRIRPF